MTERTRNHFNVKFAQIIFIVVLHYEMKQGYHIGLQHFIVKCRRVLQISGLLRKTFKCWENSASPLRE